ncbi:MAG: ferrochelatase [Burkholderiales bacterium]|jgi:ferrochelatase
MRYAPEPEYKHGSTARTGVLLVNLGTPAAATAKALRRYLKEFLSDPRVVEIPRPIWWLILHGIILRTRPKKSAEKYATVWTSEGSPLRVHTEKQAQLLRGYLGERIKSPHTVAWAMRYGAPSIDSVMTRLHAEGCDRILVVPLYPQYAASTTASVYEAVFASAGKLRNVPAIRLVKHFHDHPAYISALATQVHQYWAEKGKPEKLVLSFHGVPRFTLDRGDPYHCECQKTARLLTLELGIDPEMVVVSFQSRFGRTEWLKPYTIDTMKRLGKAKTGRVDVFCPGFVSDCLETLEEIAIENKAVFLKAGGKEFHHIPCLNERHEWIQALARIAADNLHGWASSDYDRGKAEREAQLSASLAKELGAKR